MKGPSYHNPAEYASIKRLRWSVPARTRNITGYIEDVSGDINWMCGCAEKQSARMQTMRRVQRVRTTGSAGIKQSI